MQRTRVMAIGTGLLVGGLLGGAAGMAGWRTPAAAAQDHVQEGAGTLGKLFVDPEFAQDDREARAKKAIDLARRIAELRAEFHAALEKKQGDRADKLEGELHELAGALRKLVGALRENEQHDALEMVERTLQGDGKHKKRDKAQGEQRDKPRDKKGADRDDELAAAKQKLQDLEAKIRATEEKLARAEAEGREDEAHKLRGAIEKLADQLAKGREKLERAHRDGPRVKGDRRDDDRERGPDQLQAEARKLKRHHEELQGQLEKLERGLEAAREREDGGAIEEHEAALQKTHRELHAVRGHLERLHADTEKRARDGAGRDKRGHEGGDAEALEQKLHAIRAELERAHANIEEYEQAIRRAREAGEEDKEQKHRAGLERLLAHARELKSQQQEIETWFRRQHEERAARGHRERDERPDRERDDRPRPDREAPSRGREGAPPRDGAPVDELQRELRAVREEIAGLRRQMEQMRDLLARLLHGREADRPEPGRERDERRGERRSRRIESGSFPGIPGLPGKTGNESLAPYFEALTKANEWFREVATHLNQFGPTEGAVNAFNHAHRSYAEAMNTYQAAVRQLGDQRLTDEHEEMAGALNETREALHAAVERMAEAARAVSEKRAKK